MYRLTFALTGLILSSLILSSCIGGNARTLSPETYPTSTNESGVKATLTYFKQSDRYLIVKLYLLNESAETVTLYNDDNARLSCFRVTVDGQTFVAERKGSSWSPGKEIRTTESHSSFLKIQPGITLPVEIRWNFQMDSKSYDWAVTVTGMKANEKSIGDLAIAWPSQEEKDRLKKGSPLGKGTHRNR